MSEDDMSAKFLETLRTPQVAFELDRNLFGGQPLIRVSVPGATLRSKRVEPLPVIVGNDGETHADMLRHIADAIDQATGHHPARTS